MGIDFKKLLPKNIRNGRWGEFIEAFQDVIREIKEEKSDTISRKYKINKATKAELLEVAYMFGFDILVYDGYTSTLDYVKKEVKTIVPRIKYKTTRNGYKYIYAIFNCIGDVYPTTPDNGKLRPLYEYEELGGGVGVLFLDQEGDFILTLSSSARYDYSFGYDIGLTFDATVPLYADPPFSDKPPAFLDTEEFPILDGVEGGEVITRHLLLSFKPKFIETVEEFYSLNTLKAFYNDARKMKRQTEILHFQHEVFIDVHSNNSVIEKIYTNYNKSISTSQKNILINSNLSDLATIRLGTGSHSVITTGITDVETPLVDLSIDDFWKTILIDEQVDISYKMEDKFKLPYAFTEVAFLDDIGNVLVYTTFPRYHWYEKMYNSIRFLISVEI